jgi:hypothetical protein
MTLIKKCDVKMHFAARRIKRSHLLRQANKPGTQVLPVGAIAIESNVSVFEDDFSLEHSSPGGTVSAVVNFCNSRELQKQAAYCTPRA